MLRGFNLKFRPAAVAAVPKSALSGVATYAPGRPSRLGAHHHKAKLNLRNMDARVQRPSAGGASDMADSGTNAANLNRGDSSGPTPPLAMTVPGCLFAIAAPKTNLCPALLAGHTRHGSRPSVGGRSLSRNLPSESVRKMPSGEEGFVGQCSGGKLVSVYGPMLHLSHAGDVFGSYAPASSASQESELGSEGYERPALPRQPDRPLNAFTWQFDPSQDRRNPGSRFAINNLASQRPECHDADNPSWDVPNNRQPCSDNGSAHVPSCKNGLGQ